MIVFVSFAITKKNAADMIKMMKMIKLLIDSIVEWFLKKDLYYDAYHSSVLGEHSEKAKKD